MSKGSIVIERNVARDTAPHGLSSSKRAVKEIVLDSLSEVYDASVDGDLVVINPGTFDMEANSIQLKYNVNWRFEAGVTITSSNADGTFIDNSIDTNLQFFGKPTILNTGEGVDIYLTGNSFITKDSYDEFPHYQLVRDENGSGYAFRYMVDPDNGDDKNSGLSWAKAKASIKAVVDNLPKDLLGYYVVIAIKPGTYNTWIMNNSNGDIHFVWFGETYTDPNPSTEQLWLLNGETIETTNDPIIIDGSEDNSAVNFNDTASNSFVWFHAKNTRFNPWDTGGNYAERWQFKCGTVCVLNKWNESNLRIVAPRIDMGASSNFGFELDNNCNITSPAFYGGTGSASTGTGQWNGAINVYGATGSLIDIGKHGGGYGFAVGYEPKNKNGIYIEDIAQALTLNQPGFSNKSSTAVHPILYVDNVRSYGKTNIRIASGMTAESGLYVRYSDTHCTLNDLSVGTPRTIEETDSSDKKIVINDFLEHPLPTSDPLIAGRFWSNSGIVTESTGV